jgi:CHAT domain-containing protein
MKLNANLAVLSSCGSGFGNFREGEGIQSMARSFAYAGCPSILMTLWEVADLSTVSVMERFYYYLKKGNSKSKALQLSKLEFLKNADQLRSNPFFWSSYTIVGNSEPIFTYFPWSLILKIAILLLPIPIIFLFIRSYRRQAQKNIF